MTSQMRSNKKVITIADHIAEYECSLQQHDAYRRELDNAQGKTNALKQLLAMNKLRTKTLHKKYCYYNRQKLNIGSKINRLLKFDELKKSIQICQEKEQSAQIIDKISSDQLCIEKLNNLPEDMVKEIWEFVPICVKISLIEERYSPFKLIKQLKSSATSELFRSICSNPLCYSLLSLEESSLYSFRNMTERKLNIIHIIYKLKERVPEYALQVIRNISMIIKPKPTRIYITNNDALL